MYIKEMIIIFFRWIVGLLALIMPCYILIGSLMALWFYEFNMFIFICFIFTLINLFVVLFYLYLYAKKVKLIECLRSLRKVFK